MNPLIDRGAHQIWPDITWVSLLDGDTFHIQGQNAGGHTAQREVSLTATSHGALADHMSAACQAIADELAPTFIDWEQVPA